MRKKIALSPKRKQWVGSRTTTLKGTQLHYNAGVQLKYQRALSQLTKEMTWEVKRRIMRLFRTNNSKEFFEQQKEAAMDASVTSKAKKLVNKLTKKFTQLFKQKAPKLVDNMLNGSLKVSETNLRVSLNKLSGGLTLNTGAYPAGMKDVTKAIVNENVSLIKSIPQEYFNDVAGAVMRSISAGEGAPQLEEVLTKYSKQTARRVELLALDQTRKAYNAINKQRMQGVGVKKFEWIHSGGGQHPRQSHMDIDGEIFSFDDLPLKGEEGFVNGQYPGQAINCRCTMVPVIEFENGKEL